MNDVEETERSQREANKYLKLLENFSNSNFTNEIDKNIWK